MPARGFFYDDCSDADRLAREYFANEVSLTASVGFDATIGKHYYRISKAIGGSQFSALFHVAQKFKNFDAQFLMKNNKIAPNENSFWIFKCPNPGITTGIGYADIANSSYWTKAPFDYYGAVVASGVAFAINTWYNIRFRIDGQTARYKRWVYGTVEPAWTFTLQLTNKAAAMNSGNFNNEGYVGFGTYTDLTQIINQDVADIRIAPVRRF